MKENKISWARVSKNICYFIAPVFGLLLIACIAGLIIIDTEIELEDTNNYYDTRLFSDSYLGSVRNQLNIPYYLKSQEEKETPIGISTEIESSYLIANKEYSYYADNIQENVDINGKTGRIYYATDSGNFKYLIIDTKNLVAKTNLEHTMRTDTIQKIKDIIGQNSIHWNLEDEKIDTNISNLTIEEIRYTSEYRSIKNSNITQIYTSLIDKLPYQDDYRLSKFAYDLAMKANTMAPVLIPLSIGVLLALGLIILNGIGKKGKGPGIHLNGFDKLPLEIAFAISITIIAIGACGGISLKSDFRAIMVSGVTIGAIIAYLGAMLMLETFVKRMKTHTLWKTTLLYIIGHGIKTLIDNRKITTKLVLLYGGFCVLGFIAAFTLGRQYYYMGGTYLFWFVTLAMLGIGTFLYLFKKARQFQNIQNALKAIYEGNTNIQLNSGELTGVLKQLSIYIEDIAGGLQNAVQESLKSERLKTELITNVSHDIKTPLTSIINYVDLLKKEKMPNEKATEYLIILENKSQRLKKLTEDLVEASKASSRQY